METPEEQAGIHSRLTQVLDWLSEQGATQQAIADRVRVPAQYLSDIKLRRKRVSELFARRLAERYDFDYRWLTTGEGKPPQFLHMRGGTSVPAPGLMRLPLFDSPISGEPQTLPEWTGAFVELAGAAAAQARAATEPYIVRFGKNDTEGCLKQNDLVLVSQAVNPEAAIQVVRQRQQCFLARQAPNGTLQRIATRQACGPAAKVVGHCVGIVWRVL
ncbi:MAG TPA: hypothetical protein VMR25_04690 [Planctomycetaceae bacterium]|jgi:transcriptional regulator with XRE-family HTH domain|nr:hypothetical protein [Planctomycetaceae bacterium]